MATVTAQSENFFTLNLEYGDHPDYDPDNNGVEDIATPIDFDAMSVDVDPSFNEDNLCTRWDVYSIDNDITSTSCYGSAECCNFLSLVPTQSNWTLPFVLTYGMYGASENNLVSAQVAYIDYNVSPENPFSEIYYSNWDSLPAVFNGEQVGIQSSSNYTFDDQPFSIYIASPDTSFITGEDVPLTVSFNTSVNATYTLDNENFALGEGLELTDTLQGKELYEVLGNGDHNLTIQVNNNFIFNYTFNVNDQDAPVITINLTNKTTITSETLHTVLNLSSNEHAVISYNFNSGGASGSIDLSEEKHTVASFTPIYGTNTLTITSIDMHGNSHQNIYEFTYSEEATCSDGKQNGNEEGIDCGGNCNDCIPFEVSLDKSTYEFGEDVFVTVQARANSFVDLKIFKNSNTEYEHNFTPVFSGAPIAETRKVVGVANPGLYVVHAEMHFLNNVQTKTLNFDVQPEPQSSLSVAIGANATTINEGNTITFSSAVSGQEGSLTYAWDFENDGTTDSSQQNPSKTFGNNGTYLVNLTVTDSEASKSTTQKITVKNVFEITVIARQNGTNANIDGAEITVGSENKSTASDGKAKYTISEGNHNIRIEKNGYQTYSKSHEFEYGTDFIVNLTKIDTASPRVHLTSPNELAPISNSDNVSLTFFAEDDTILTCTLYFAPNASSFAGATDVKNNVEPDKEYSFTVKNLVNTIYKWRVDCVDRKGNHNNSYTRHFIYKNGGGSGDQPETLQATTTAVPDDSEDKGAIEVIEEINEVIHTLDKLPTREKEAATTMQLRSYLEKQRLNVERANRDISSLVWRRLNGTDLEQEEQNILGRIETVKRTTPRTITSADSFEFVKYADQEAVSNLLHVLINKTNINFNKKELRSLVEDNTNLQNDLTVTTKAHVLDLEFISGDSGSITIIEKTIENKNPSLDLKIYEIIPKEIASLINETTILGEFEVVEKDPIISIDRGSTSLVYYVFDTLSETDIEKTQTILFDPRLKPSAKSAFTGLAVFDNFGLAFVRTADFRLVIEILIILLLAGIYLIYSFGGIESIRNLMHGKEVKELQQQLETAKGHVASNEYEKASGKYKEISGVFAKLDSKKKEVVKSDVMNLGHDVNMLFIDKLVQEATITAKTSKKHALAIYKKIESLYKIIPKKHKGTVSKKCLELHKNLVAK